MKRLVIPGPFQVKLRFSISIKNFLHRITLADSLFAGPSRGGGRGGKIPGARGPRGPGPALFSKETRRAGVASESYNPEADQISLSNCSATHDKTAREMEILQEKVKNVLVFRSLDEHQMCKVLAAMFKVEIPKGSHVIRQGDDGDFFYVVDSGIFEAYVKDTQGQEQRVTTYKGTGSFGELALLYNMPRIATVKAITDGSLWCLDRESFRKIVLKSAFSKRQIYENLLANIPMLQCMTEYERQILADALHPMTYEDGECIIRQSEDAAGMFIVEEGTVLFSYVDETGKKMQLSEIEKGGYFGELALVTDKQRAVSAYAIGHVRLAYIDKESFERLLGPCMDLMKRNVKKYEDQLKSHLSK
ncbi:unnamed protein product [Nesidiocoris tenuis]|uniref:Cyclic nucleotide-binding domain-containing protein n=1 Tax=Nesidiocoris tenuis TaxID=355587 RepID=A0A6H5FZH1_9HEMI|nr:unnamed protein product [Nesidiocoris tenuis]CAA9995252.1 unnamed protein product [Nesidiocoris tenuis]